MRKKFLTALLTVTMFTCAFMTGCGSENEVTESKDDKEVVTEQSSYAESNEDEQMEVSSENEDKNSVDETIEEENMLSLLTAFQMLDETNNAYIYTTKMLKSDDTRIDENTSVYIFKLNIMNSTATKMLMDDADTFVLKNVPEMLSVMTEDSTDVCDVAIMPIVAQRIENETIINDTIAKALLGSDNFESTGMYELITYFGSKIDYVEISGVRYAVFTTDTVEGGTEYSYYTLIDMSNFTADAELQLPDMPDDDPNKAQIMPVPSNIGGLTDCDPSVESDNIRTPYVSNDMILIK